MWHCIKYARIRVFTEPYSPVKGQNRQNRRFWPYVGEYGSEKPVLLHILCSVSKCSFLNIPRNQKRGYFKLLFQAKTLPLQISSNAAKNICQETCKYKQIRSSQISASVNVLK